MKPLRAGLIGYGYAGKTFHAPLLASCPDWQLQAVASSNPAKVVSDWPGVVVETNPQALIARGDIDLVVIATPNHTHFPLAHEALAAGKHVVVDKPFTLTVDEAAILAGKARASDQLLSVFHNRRWDGDFLSLRQLLAQGRLGEVSYLESHFDRFRPMVRQRWREQVGPGSGLWFDLGPHLIDQMLPLLGLPQQVQADIATLRPDATTDDYFHVVFHYPQCRVVLHASMLCAAPGPRFVVHGSQGSYRKSGLDLQEEHLKLGRLAANVAEPDGELTLVADDQVTTQPWPTLSGNYGAYYQGVAAAIRGCGPNPVTPEEAIRVMELLELAQASAQRGCSLPCCHRAPV